MATILLQTTITANTEDWNISRFSLLATELRAAGHRVVARDRISPGTTRCSAMSTSWVSINSG